MTTRVAAVASKYSLRNRQSPDISLGTAGIDRTERRLVGFRGCLGAGRSADRARALRRDRRGLDDFDREGRGTCAAHDRPGWRIRRRRKGRDMTKRTHVRAAQTRSWTMVRRRGVVVAVRDNRVLVAGRAVGVPCSSSLLNEPKPGDPIHGVAARAEWSSCRTSTGANRRLGSSPHRRERQIRRSSHGTLRRPIRWAASRAASSDASSQAARTPAPLSKRNPGTLR